MTHTYRWFGSAPILRNTHIEKHSSTNTWPFLIIRKPRDSLGHHHQDGWHHHDYAHCHDHCFHQWLCTTYSTHSCHKHYDGHWHNHKPFTCHNHCYNRCHNHRSFISIQAPCALWNQPATLHCVRMLLRVSLLEAKHLTKSCKEDNMPQRLK